jgi:hypothetical protein
MIKLVSMKRLFLSFALFSSGLSLQLGCSRVGDKPSKLSEASLSTACGVVSEEFRALRFVVQNCVDLKNPQAAIVNSCIRVAADALPDTGSACRNIEGPKFRKLLVDLQLLQIERIPLQSDLLDPADSEKLVGAARNLAFWFQQGNALYDGKIGIDQESEGEFQSDFIKVYSAFWEKFAKKISYTIATSGGQEDIQLGFRSKLYREIFVASALPGAEEISGSILYSYLSSLADRVKMLAYSSDFSCRLGFCQQSTSQVQQLVNLLAGLPNQRELQRAIDRATGVSQEVKAFFQSVADNHALLVSYLSGANGRYRLLNPNFATLTFENQKKAILGYSASSESILTAAQLVGLNRDFIEMQEKYRLFGVFAGLPANRLDFGPSDEAVQTINTVIGGLNVDLQDGISRFGQNKERLLQQLIQSSESDSAIARVEGERVSNEIAAIYNDIENLRLKLSNRKKQQEEYLTQVAKLEAGNFSRFVPVGNDSIPLQARAVDAVYAHNEQREKWVSIKEVAISPKSYNVSSEVEVVELNVNGRWAPKCALRRNPPFRDLARNDLAIDSAGYQLSFSSSSASLDSKTVGRSEINYQDRGVKREICLSASAGTGGGMYSASASASLCEYASTGVRKEESVTENAVTSAESRQTAGFSAGLRLAETPFPSYPAGALLAVISLDDNRSSIRDVQVVESRTRLLLKRGERLFFVVNDCSDPNSASSGTLSIASQVSQNEGTLAVKLLNVFIDGLKSEEIQAELRSLESQGTDISTSLNLIRSKIIANAELISGGTVSFQSIPVLTSLYQFWLDSMIDEVSDRHKIGLLQRQLVDLRLKLQSLDVQLQAAEQRNLNQAKFVLELVSNIDVKVLEQNLTRSLHFMNYSLAPVLDLYYPSVELFDEISQLQVLTLESDALAVARSLDSIMRSIQSKLRVATSIRQLSPSQYDTVIVQVPRPELSSLDLARPPVEKNTPIANLALRASVWEGLRSDSRQDISFSVRPEDLFQATSSNSLSCSQTLPIIVSSALGFVLNNELATETTLLERLNRGARVTATLGPKTVFATSVGYKDYLIPSRTNTSSHVSQLPVVFGDSVTSTLREFNNRVRGGSLGNSGFGFSPFSDFKVRGLDLIRDQDILPTIGTVDLVEQILLILYVKFDSFDGIQSWISSCS